MTTAQKRPAGIQQLPSATFQFWDMILIMEILGLIFKRYSTLFLHLIITVVSHGFLSIFVIWNVYPHEFIGSLKNVDTRLFKKPLIVSLQCQLISVMSRTMKYCS